MRCIKNSDIVMTEDGDVILEFSGEINGFDGIDWKIDEYPDEWMNILRCDYLTLADDVCAAVKRAINKYSFDGSEAGDVYDFTVKLDINNCIEVTIE